MAVISTVRTARKERTCDMDISRVCDRTIKPGDRYRYSSLTPNDPEISNIGWWHHAECAKCAEVCGRPIEAVAS